MQYFRTPIVPADCLVIKKEYLCNINYIEVLPIKFQVTYFAL